MPYVPPGSTQPQRLFTRVDTPVVATITEDLPTPHPSRTTSTLPDVDEIKYPPKDDSSSSEDTISSQLAAARLSPPYPSCVTDNSPPLLSHSQGRPSPATTSVHSLGDQSEEGVYDDIELAVHREHAEFRKDEEQKKGQARIKVVSAERRCNGGDDPLSLYSKALYAYTHKLFLTAKRSSLKADKRQTSFSQFGSKASGMEKAVQKKALARRLNS
ncbi:uncharacterized protein L203_106439 [Cryptococcus depauperatus CBS 7841]|uniref:Uncharacterized protein n=1 Tax=Cryptococcus depauperatus CBS 7841 TaxID=1295531 RepID=A0A1E3IJE3_9TREE|nr:hypothetical protein L203_02558 [Cryptococcus depauperatus CBS 7841]